MTDDKPRDPAPDDETQPVRPQAAAYDTPAAAAAEPAAKRGFRERFRRVRSTDGNRAFSLGALVASALAGLIVGGIGVQAVHAVTQDDRPDRSQQGPMGRGGFEGERGDGDQQGGPGFGRPGGGSSGTPPTTPPEQESDDSGSSSSSNS